MQGIPRQREGMPADPAQLQLKFRMRWGVEVEDGQTQACIVRSTGGFRASDMRSSARTQASVGLVGVCLGQQPLYVCVRV